MVEKFAITGGMGSSEFIDLNRTSRAMILVPLFTPKFAPNAATNSGELRNGGTTR